MGKIGSCILLFWILTAPLSGQERIVERLDLQGITFGNVRINIAAERYELIAKNKELLSAAFGSLQGIVTPEPELQFWLASSLSEYRVILREGLNIEDEGRFSAALGNRSYADRKNRVFLYHPGADSDRIIQLLVTEYGATLLDSVVGQRERVPIFTDGIARYFAGYTVARTQGAPLESVEAALMARYAKLAPKEPLPLFLSRSERLEVGRGDPEGLYAESVLVALYLVRQYGLKQVLEFFKHLPEEEDAARLFTERFQIAPEPLQEHYRSEFRAKNVPTPASEPKQ